jgi:tRNA uridine 5-carbamoylmethylation protein Kti12
MALITVSGFPSSGKTRRASQLKAHLENYLADPDYNGPRLSVSLISEEVLDIQRNVYDGAHSVYPVCSTVHIFLDPRTEKLARAALFTAMQRQMNQSTILIVDAPNYIKGFRYQMYCAAREVKLRVCTVRFLLISGLQPSFSISLNRYSSSPQLNCAGSGTVPVEPAVLMHLKRLPKHYSYQAQNVDSFHPD